MLDDLFVPRDVEDLVAEATGTNTGDAEAPVVELLELKQAREWMV